MKKDQVKKRTRSLDVPKPLTLKECECLIRFPVGSESEKNMKEMIQLLIEIMDKKGYALVSQTAQSMYEIYKDRSKIDFYQDVKDSFEKSKLEFLSKFKAKEGVSCESN